MRLPNAELVGQAWIYTYTGVPAAQVAGTLPKPEKWTASTDGDGVGFLQVRALAGGGVDPTLPQRRTSVLQLDGWGTRTVRDTMRPVWAVAEDLLERIRVATFPDVETYGRSVSMPLAGYLDARVLSVYLLGEPTRVEGDPSGYARMTAPLSVTWTV